ncbi:DUF2480 family protein [Flagellimonas baculiformis]|uniref:DUF2480 family protein n=1 Tax=Flagellimonas baculiformis TaxID=3067310 RepID=UPI00296FAF55|nr:DUF2480 family protein [Muricauda sp. D6]
MVQNGILTLDLLEYQPKEKSQPFDIKDGLTHGMILVEKEFRLFLSQMDWEFFRGKPVAVACTEDAIVPQWAFMAISAKLQGIASEIALATPDQLNLRLWRESIESSDFSHLKGQRVVVQQNSHIAPELYMSITEKLKPWVAALFYGEAGLPKVIYKRKEK